MSMVDEKKRKRMISNRESARRSRMKKEIHMKDLNQQIFYFMKKRDEMVLKIEGISKQYSAMESENMVLRSQKQELEKRLEYAKIVYVGDIDGVSMSSMVGAVQEPWLRPWEQHQPSNFISIMSSAGFSSFN